MIFRPFGKRTGSVGVATPLIDPANAAAVEESKALHNYLLIPLPNQSGRLYLTTDGQAADTTNYTNVYAWIEPGTPMSDRLLGINAIQLSRLYFEPAVEGEGLIVSGVVA